MCYYIVLCRLFELKIEVIKLQKIVQGTLLLNNIKN